MALFSLKTKADCVSSAGLFISCLLGWLLFLLRLTSIQQEIGSNGIHSTLPIARPLCPNTRSINGVSSVGVVTVFLCENLTTTKLETLDLLIYAQPVLYFNSSEELNRVSVWLSDCIKQELDCCKSPGGGLNICMKRVDSTVSIETEDSEIYFMNELDGGFMLEILLRSI
jgi:hypothetical protein